MRWLIALLLCIGAAQAQVTSNGPPLPTPLPTTMGGTGVTAGGGQALDNVLNPGGNGILERTGANTWVQDSIPLSVSKGGIGATSLPSGQVLLGAGTSAPTGLSEVDGDCVVGVSGNWTVGSCLPGTNPFPTIITSFCSDGGTTCSSGNNSCVTATPCTWTRGSNTVVVLVYGCGAGGSGGSGGATHSGGGGGPGFCNPQPYILTPTQAGTSQTVIVGAGATSPATAGGSTCFGSRTTCSSPRNTSDLFFWGGGGPGVTNATTSAFPGSPYEVGGNAADNPNGSFTSAVSGSSGVGGTTGALGTAANGTVYGATGGASGGHGNFAGGNGGWGVGCTAIPTGGSGATSGTGGGSTGGSVITGAFLPGCSGGGGGGATTGTGGPGGAAIGFAQGGGGGGGYNGAGVAGGAGGNSGYGFLVVVELQ